MNVVSNAITVDEAADLAATVQYKNFSHRVIDRLVGHIREVYSDVSTGDPAYCRVEQKSIGHPWHIDTGNKGHMAWCRVSARVLLSDPARDFTGGGFYFRDDPDTPIFGYRDLQFFRADRAHSVASHNGDRRVLLMFLGEDGESDG
jgi:hypothetical protein